jgi:ABC-type polysaccharide transport system permease subunit
MMRQPRVSGARTRYDKRIFFYTFPLISLVFLFAYAPLFGWSYAFFDYKPGIRLAQSEFVGLKYFKLAFSQGSELLTVMRNTLVLSFLGLATTPIPVVLAILITEMSSSGYRKAVQTATTLPHFISWVLVYAVFFSVFSLEDGIVNELLQRFGLARKPINVLANERIVWFFQTSVTLWKNMGWSAIIYIAAATGINPELYEAAKVDGAGRFRRIVHITVPGILPTYMVILIIRIGFLLTNGFEQYYVFYNALVHDKIQVLDYYVYRIGVALNDFAFGTALSMFKSMISITLFFGVNLLSKKATGKAII